ncbi:hypothetical protein [Achromobacter sp. PAB15]|uniref:hypothetical protein n=1 Tax=Achromobacter sp. PAB15 TaxID=3233048 RepID=UPI003F8E704A
MRQTPRLGRFSFWAVESDAPDLALRSGGFKWLSEVSLIGCINEGSTPGGNVSGTIKFRYKPLYITIVADQVLFFHLFNALIAFIQVSFSGQDQNRNR